MRLPFLRRQRTGRWEGGVCYCSEPYTVPFEGHYGLKFDEKGFQVPDPDTPVHWVSIKKLLPDEEGVEQLYEIDGWWEHGRV